MARQVKLRRFQFSLRMLLALIALLAILLGMVQMHPARHQSRAAAAIRDLGGYAAVEPVGPEWIRALFGDEYFVRVSAVGLDFAQATDDTLALLEDLQDLEWLYIGGEYEFPREWSPGERGGDLGPAPGIMWTPSHVTHVTDAGIEHLKGLVNVRVLYLQGAQITDKGLGLLHQMTRLEQLGLAGTNVSDGCATQLKALPSLKSVDLTGTLVTRMGTWKIRMQLPNLEIDYNPSYRQHNPTLMAATYDEAAQFRKAVKEFRRLDTVRRLRALGAKVRLIDSEGKPRAIVDIGEDWIGGNDGLNSIKRVPDLYSLSIEYNPGITDQGLRHLAGLTMVRSLWLGDVSISDAGLVHLHGLASLEEVIIFGKTKVTESGVAALRDALPNAYVRRSQ